jgi:hypothetical protein
MIPEAKWIYKTRDAPARPARPLSFAFTPAMRRSLLLGQAGNRDDHQVDRHAELGPCGRSVRVGNRYLKIAFHHAAIRAIQYVPEMKAEFHCWQRRKGKPFARALIAKELATIVYAMLAKGEPFNKQIHGHSVSTTKRGMWPRVATRLPN